MEKIKWIILFVFVGTLAILATFDICIESIKYKIIDYKLNQIIQKQEQIISVLYAPPIYEKRIIFYEAADPFDTETKVIKPKRKKP